MRCECDWSEGVERYKMRGGFERRESTNDTQQAVHQPLPLAVCTSLSGLISLVVILAPMPQLSMSFISWSLADASRGLLPLAYS